MARTEDRALDAEALEQLKGAALSINGG